MDNLSPHDHMPDGYVEDRPFHMSEPAHIGLTDIRETVDSFQMKTPKADRIPFPRNSFLGGVCLALPLSALIWILIIYVL